MNDLELRAYLLGRMPPADAERLEERLLDDEELFQALRAVEAELFDDHARGRLGAEERAPFSERYGGQADRLAFARALARRGAGARVVPFVRRSWVPLASAAALLLAVGGLLNRGPAPSPVESSPPRAEAPRGAEPPVLRLTLGTSRSAGHEVPVAVPAGASALRLRVRLDPADRFDRYSLDLRSSLDRVVWAAADLRASTEAGELELVADVPVRELADGAYELSVRGASTGATPEDLGFMTLGLRRAR